MPRPQVAVEYILQRTPRKIDTTTSRHLLELDEYERQKTVLTKTKKELARVLSELGNSQTDIAAARLEANNAHDAYNKVLSELDQTNEELVDNKRQLHLALNELEYTREELERMRWDLLVSAGDMEAVTEHLNEAYEHIDELYQLLDFQEAVAINALNFVATTAVTQQRETAAHAMNSVASPATRHSNDDGVIDWEDVPRE